MKTLIKLLLTGITTVFASGCVENYRGEFVMNPAGRAWTKTGRAYDNSGAAFSQLRVGRGFVKGGEGILRTLGSTVTTVNNTADLAVGSVTTGLEYITEPVPGLCYVGDGIDGFRKTTLDSFVGGEDFNESWSFSEGHNPLTNSFYSAEDHHGPGFVAAIDGTYKTLVRFTPLAAVAAGGGGGGEGTPLVTGGPGPGPVDPFLKDVRDNSNDEL